MLRDLRSERQSCKPRRGPRRDVVGELTRLANPAINSLRVLSALLSSVGSSSGGVPYMSKSLNVTVLVGVWA